MDEVEFGVVPLDICGIVLGSLYLYDRKEIFFREKNQYYLFKEGIKYIVHSHLIKIGRPFVTMEQLKRETCARKSLTLMLVQSKESKHKMEVTKLDFGHKDMFKYSCKVQQEVLSHEVVDLVPFIKGKHVDGAISFKSIYLVLLLILLLFNSVWLVAKIVNEDMFENVINVLKNVSAILIIVVMSLMYRF